MLKFWILDESGEPLEANLDTWARWLEHNNGQRIIHQEDVDGYWISTVFVGCNSKFETMIFSPEPEATSIWQSWSDTLKEALGDHERALRAVDNREFTATYRRSS
jgi:hypothetical protein